MSGYFQDATPSTASLHHAARNLSAPSYFSAKLPFRDEYPPQQRLAPASSGPTTQTRASHAHHSDAFSRAEYPPEQRGHQHHSSPEGRASGGGSVAAQVLAVPPADRLAKARLMKQQIASSASSSHNLPTDDTGAVGGGRDYGYHRSDAPPAASSSVVAPRRVTVSSFFEQPPQGRAEAETRRRNAAHPVSSISVDFSPVPASERTTAAQNTEDSLQRLFIILPFLSADFRCDPRDAAVLVEAIETGWQHSRGGGGDESPSRVRARLEERIAVLEQENANLTQKIERRDDEIDRWKGEAGEAKQRWQALEAQTKQTLNLVSQKREEGRKQLLMEEGKVAKLQFQVKTLQAEVDRLKDRLHTALAHR